MLPSTLQAGGNPSLTAGVTLAYPNSTDTVSSATITLAPGILANPAVVPTRCSAAQLSSYTCPAASQVATGFVTARVYDATGVSGVENLPAAAFLMPEPAGQTADARAGRSGRLPRRSGRGERDG